MNTPVFLMPQKAAICECEVSFEMLDFGAQSFSGRIVGFGSRTVIVDLKAGAPTVSSFLASDCVVSCVCVHPQKKVQIPLEFSGTVSRVDGAVIEVGWIENFEDVSSFIMFSKGHSSFFSKLLGW